MSQDIFNRVVDLGDPLAADATHMILPTQYGGGDMLCQNVSINYQQNITRLYEVGTSKTYFFAGRTAGTIAMKRIIGEKQASLQFVESYGDVCQMKGHDLSYTMQAGCASATFQGKITAKACVVNSVGYSMAAAEMIINEDLQIMFALLQK